MSLIYNFDGKDRLLHRVADWPSSIRDFEDVVPGMLRKISETNDILLLIEDRDFAHTSRR